MNRFRVLAVSLLLLGVAVPAIAQEEEKNNKAWIEFSGFYAFNAYSQQNFFLGRTRDADRVLGVSDDDKYAIQMFRVQTEFGVGKYVKAVLRTDFAQGIWGIDNTRFGSDDNVPGFSRLFNGKDTNFLVHVDWAYVDFTYPSWRTNFKLGRQKFALGNLLILDQDNDGLQTRTMIGADDAFKFGWSIMNEGSDSLSDSGAIGPDDVSTKDANVFIAQYELNTDKWMFNPYLVYYKDGSGEGGNTYIPDRLQYLRPRFTPQLGEATVLGFAFEGHPGKWNFKGEGAILTGKDPVDNFTAGLRNVRDVNNGDLEGYTLYFDARRQLGPGKIGALIGLGSGDDDVMSGKGNLVKIRTNGFFYVTEVWEDSIMPDENGITPQGLGSPASRGYREFENSQLIQVNYLWNFSDRWNLFVSGTFVQATEEILAWAEVIDTNGNDLIDPEDDFSQAGLSRELGPELDFRLTWKMLPGLTFIARGGAFWPGAGAGYLINGTDTWQDTAYEGRITLKYSWGKVKFGG